MALAKEHEKRNEHRAADGAPYQYTISGIPTSEEMTSCRVGFGGFACRTQSNNPPFVSFGLTCATDHKDTADLLSLLVTCMTMHFHFSIYGFGPSSSSRWSCIYGTIRYRSAPSVRVYLSLMIVATFLILVLSLRPLYKINLRACEVLQSIFPYNLFVSATCSGTSSFMFIVRGYVGS